MDQWARPPSPGSNERFKKTRTRVEAGKRSLRDSSDLSQSGHAFARASRALKSVGYRHREGDPKDEQDPSPQRKRPQMKPAPTPTVSSARPRRNKFEKLKESDTRVRAHEMAHKAAAGSLAAGGPCTTFNEVQMVKITQLEARFRSGSLKRPTTKRPSKMLGKLSALWHRRTLLQMIMRQPPPFAREHWKHAQSFQTRNASPPPRAQKKRMQRLMRRSLRHKVTSKTLRALPILPKLL